MADHRFRKAMIALALLLSASGAEAQTSANSSAASSDTTKSALDRKMETVVVTAARKEQLLDDVPASVSVVGVDVLQLSPADNMADALRAIPGLNIAQTSAATFSISTRAATNIIPQGQLSMVDYRTTYQDFNGFTFWGTTPIEFEDLDRIEVIRGPGSAVWGANALHGVVHLVTKAPKDMVGTRIKIGGGELGTADASLTHAGVRGRLGYRISGGYSQQDPFDAPSGTIPGTEGPSNPLGTPYPEWENLQMERPRVNARLDFDVDDRTTWSFSGGYAQVRGSFMSPGGPSTLEDAVSAFGKIDWTRDSMRATAFVNRDTYSGLFQLGNVEANQKDHTYNADFSDTRAIGERNIVTYGGNVRYNTYDNDLAPRGDTRETYGLFLQDDLYINDLLRIVAGARWDNVDPMGGEISPRVSLIVTPLDRQQFRFSYNHAFQAPSVLQNYIEFTQVALFDLPDFNNPGSSDTVPVPIPIGSLGNPDLDPKRLDAYEAEWIGRLGQRLRLSVVGYVNDFTDSFQTVPLSFYTASNPPPGWPFDPALLDGPLAGALVAKLGTTNLGKSIERGVEASAEVQLGHEWSLFGNWSWQDAPDLEDLTPSTLPSGSERAPVNVAPRNRFNLGASWDNGQIYANANLNHQGDAFWADVLDARFWGPTEPFTMVNAGVGVRLANERVVLSVNGINIFDERVQQHVWGDTISRRITAQVAYRF